MKYIFLTDDRLDNDTDASIDLAKSNSDAKIVLSSTLKYSILTDAGIDSSRLTTWNERLKSG